MSLILKYSSLQNILCLLMTSCVFFLRNLDTLSILLNMLEAILSEMRLYFLHITLNFGQCFCCSSYVVSKEKVLGIPVYSFRVQY